MQLNNEEIRRYSRHLILPEVGLAGQKKIKSTSVLCIGAGGLGSPIAMYLAAAGIGKIGIVDFDTVDYSNLNRQILHTDADVGRSKAESACTNAEDAGGFNFLLPGQADFRQNQMPGVATDFFIVQLHKINSKGEHTNSVAREIKRACGNGIVPLPKAERADGQFAAWTFGK